MNIGFIIQTYPNFGGTERVTEILASALIQRGHTVHVLSWKPGRADMTQAVPMENIHVMPMPDNMNAAANNAWVATMVDTLVLDILVNQGPFWHGEIGQKCKIISVLHYAPGYKLSNSVEQIKRIYRERKGKSFRYRAVASLRRAFPHFFAHLDFIREEKPNLKRTMSNSDAFVLLCPEYEAELRQLMRSPLPCQVLSIANPPTFQPLTDVPDKEKLIIFLGRLTRWDKRPDRMLDIWSHICRDCPEYSLTFVGDGPEREALGRRVAEAKLPRVHFLGFADSRPLLLKATALCMTSDSEGAPMVIREAQACACVPFAFDVSPGIHRQIEQGRDGFLISPPHARREKEALKTYASTLSHFLHSARATKKTIQLTCIKRAAESSSIDEATDKWLQLFQHILHSDES